MESIRWDDMVTNEEVFRKVGEKTKLQYKKKTELGKTKEGMHQLRDDIKVNGKCCNTKKIAQNRGMEKTYLMKICQGGEIPMVKMHPIKVKLKATSKWA